LLQTASVSVLQYENQCTEIVRI